MENLNIFLLQNHFWNPWLTNDALQNGDSDGKQTEAHASRVSPPFLPQQKKIETNDDVESN